MAIKIRFRHIMSVLLVIFVSCNMSSCIFDKRDADEDILLEGNADQALFVLHVMPMNTRAFPEDGVQEKIKSLRVIAISKGENGKSDVIEMNRRVDFDDVLSAYFGYSFTWYTKPGKKDFYLIANEESVSDIRGCKDESITKLTDLLNQYEATPNPDDAIIVDADPNITNTDDKKSDSTTADGDEIEDEEGKAKEFKQIMQMVYFEPQYKTLESADGEDESGTREIYLPYSACYEDVDVKAWKDNGNAPNNQTMYLVPVATKFYFKFINNREGDIEIQNLKIVGELVDKTEAVGGVGFVLDNSYEGKVMVGGLNKANYLMANIGNTSPDYRKKLADDDKDYYWIDWLAKVSDLSSSNSFVNDIYGWISDYGMPEQHDVETWVLVDKDTDNGKYPLVKGTKNVPDEEEKSKDENEEQRTFVMGPYYMPESKYEVTYTNDVEQRYILNLYLHDASSASTAGALDFEFAEQIDNVKALFRSTYVIIVVRMSGQVDLDIYAEMAGWNANSVYGKVTER